MQTQINPNAALTESSECLRNLLNNFNPGEVAELLDEMTDYFLDRADKPYRQLYKYDRARDSLTLLLISFDALDHNKAHIEH